MLNNFKSINTKLVLIQLYKSRDIITIAMLRNTKLKDISPLESYSVGITKLVNSLAKLYNNIDEIPISKYVEPSLHLNDMIYYIDSQRHIFKNKAEQKIIDRILNLMKNTKNSLVYIED